MYTSTYHCGCCRKTYSDEHEFHSHKRHVEAAIEREFRALRTAREKERALEKARHSPERV